MNANATNRFSFTAVFLSGPGVFIFTIANVSDLYRIAVSRTKIFQENAKYVDVSHI